jgi:chromosome partitioning protein
MSDIGRITQGKGCNRHVKIVTFGTLKGGVGKTMLCYNIGGMLSQTGNRVLIIDSDLQGNLTNNIGLDRTKEMLTLYDVYNTEQRQPNPEALVYRQPNPALPNLDIIPGSIFLHRAELKLAATAGREQVLQGYFLDHRDFFGQYDHILIDTNPSMSVVNQNAFLVSDSILLISDISMNSIEGSQLFIALWEESRSRLRVKDNVRGFIVNDYDVRNRLSSDFLEYLDTAVELADLRALRMNTVIPRNIKITEAELAALPISLYDMHSKGCLAITNLIEELEDKGIL